MSTQDAIQNGITRRHSKWHHKTPFKMASNNSITLKCYSKIIWRLSDCHQKVKKKKKKKKKNRGILKIFLGFIRFPHIYQIYQKSPMKNDILGQRGIRLDSRTS